MHYWRETRIFKWLVVLSQIFVLRRFNIICKLLWVKQEKEEQISKKTIKMPVSRGRKRLISSKGADEEEMEVRLLIKKQKQVLIIKIIYSEIKLRGLWIPHQKGSPKPVSMHRLKTVKWRHPAPSKKKNIKTPRIKRTTTLVQTGGDWPELVAAGEVLGESPREPMGSPPRFPWHAVQYTGLHHEEDLREITTAYHELGDP